MLKTSSFIVPIPRASAAAAMSSVLCLVLAQGCSHSTPAPDHAAEPAATAPAPTEPVAAPAQRDEFKVFTERFADVQVLRYQVPGFEQLSAAQKKLLYYLQEAALSGRDILYDQKYKHNLAVRRTLECVLETYTGKREIPAFEALHGYLKRVWFSNGVHHHYSTKKLPPEGFTAQDFSVFVKGADASKLPLGQGETVEQLVAKLTPVIFDPSVDERGVNLDPGKDAVRDSANNFYVNLTQKEVEAFYKKRIDKKDKKPISHGLNSQLVKLPNGKIEERVWKVGGMYTKALERMVYWLEQAVTVAESDKQKRALELLIKYYQTGDLRTFDEYSIAWVENTDTAIDLIHGFIETYGDALGYRANYEAVVQLRDEEATKRIATLSDNAKWFELQSPIDQAFKKTDVVGISARVISAVVEAGDSAPSTPIGINLPNANWIRQEHGSKSVTLGNILFAYDAAERDNGVLEEFAFDAAEMARARAHGGLSGALKVDLHEVIGHASGRLAEGVATPKETLKQYSSTIEEGRADLVALYYLMDPHLVELGVMPSLEVGHAAYDSYVRNALLVQLARIKPGENLEESHMRNRQLIAGWAFEKGKDKNVIERVQKDGEDFFVIRDYQALRELFGELLKEVQRIKSKGDFAAAQKLVEGYGVKVDGALHAQVLTRYSGLRAAPYSGFIQPRLVPVEANGEITDVKVEYPSDFSAQQLEFARKYSLLPAYN
jgi:dipeptidyl-peptidase-3